jgi:hypothetical protein
MEKTGIVEGEILPDRIFSQKAMVETLKQKRPLLAMCRVLHDIS